MGENNITKFTHIFFVPFTGFGAFNGFRGNTWLKNRLHIFEEFVLKSILLQKDIIVWFQWRKEEKTNNLVIDFMERMKGVKGLNCVHTFSGITMWDDKYDDKTAAERLMSALKGSLPELKDIVKEDLVLLTIQPSDDMYLCDIAERTRNKFTELLSKEKNYKQAVGLKKGYIICYNTKEIAEYTTDSWCNDGISTYHTDTTPPFFTILFPRDVFLDAEKHFKHTGPYKSHEYIIDVMPYTALEGRGFIVGTHGENISTTYNHRYKGRIQNKEETEELMIKTGTLTSKPIDFKLSNRVRIRQFINKLPFREILKNIYNKLPVKLKII